MSKLSNRRSAKAATFDCHLIDLAPNLYGSSCGWWGHRTGSVLFRLSPTGPPGRAGHQTPSPGPVQGLGPSIPPGRVHKPLFVTIICLLNRNLSGSSSKTNLPWGTLSGAIKPQQHGSWDH